MFRRLVGWLIRPFWKSIVRIMPDGDPWERLQVAPQLTLYGPGARRDFPHYLAGASSVVVSSFDEIQDWLLGCRYEHDDVLFAEPDFWQHPATFERLREGDCEDFALWAWRKMVDLGMDADIVAGYCVANGKLGGRHAWIVFRRDGKEFVFEPGAGSKELMVHPLADVKDEYIPEVGADRTGHRFAFTGYVMAQKRQLREQSSRRTA